MKRSKSTSPRNSFTLRHSSSTWSIMSTKRKRKASPTLTRQASTSENLLADINKLDSKGRSLLFLAARCDQPEVAVQLLAAGCDANLADSEGNTPLHEAAECGHKEVVHILLHNGNYTLHMKPFRFWLDNYWIYDTYWVCVWIFSQINIHLHISSLST